jgi:proteic killer suppression protein
MVKVNESRQAQKDLDKAPKEILASYEIWARLIEEHGTTILRKFPGYNDEMLRGDWQGFRTRLQEEVMSRKSRIVLDPGQVVKELRQKKAWTQKVLSEITGMAVANISNIESGRSKLGEDRAILLAEALGVKPEFILFPNGFEREDLQHKLEAIREKLRQYDSAS